MGLVIRIVIRARTWKKKFICREARTVSFPLQLSAFCLVLVSFDLYSLISSAGVHLICPCSFKTRCQRGNTETNTERGNTKTNTERGNTETNTERGNTETNTQRGNTETNTERGNTETSTERGNTETNTER